MPLGKGKYKVSAYLSDEELELLESLCQTWQCNKSQAVIRAIKTLASNSSHSDEGHFNFSTPIGVTRDELEQSLSDAIAPIQSQLTEFDKAFQSLGGTVHNHDQMLSQPVSTKQDLHIAIAILQTEIEGLKKH